MQNLALFQPVWERNTTEKLISVRVRETGGDKKLGNQMQGCQIWAQSGSDWNEMGQIWDFLKSDFSTFWLCEPKWIRMAPNEINLGLFKIRIQYILAL